MKKLTLILSTILLLYTQTTNTSAAFICALWMESTRKNEVMIALLEKKERQQLNKGNLASESSSTNEQSDKYSEPISSGYTFVKK